MADEPLPPTDPAEAIAELRARIAELETELRALRGGREAQETELTGLRAELAKLLNPPTPARGRRFDGFFEVDN